MSMRNAISFHIPVRPYSPIDAHNRSAAAKGSPRYAMLTSHADYNGHHVSLAWNEYRGYYVAEYFWAGRVVLARGDFAHCLKAALAEHARGALGSSAGIYPREDDVDAIALARSTDGVVEGDIWQDQNSPWWTWRHQVGRESARDAANPRMPVLIFNWEICQATDSREAYEEAIKAKYGRVYT